MPLFNDASQAASQDYPTSDTHWWGQAKVLTGNPFVIGYNAGCDFGRYVYQNPPALNDEVYFESLLAAGNYKLDFRNTKSNNRGIVTVFLNDASIGSINLYSSSTVYNAVSSINFSVQKKGLQAFRVKVTGKDPSSISPFYYVSGAVIFIDKI